jgi:exodeoxyribonuclease VII small subunit
MIPEPARDLPFEAALDQLGQIVSDLEQGEPELATALTKYEQAIRLLAHCHTLIDGAEQTVALLNGVDEQGQPLTTPFDASTTSDPESPTPTARKVSPDGANRSRSRASDNPSTPF